MALQKNIEWWFKIIDPRGYQIWYENIDQSQWDANQLYFFQQSGLLRELDLADIEQGTVFDFRRNEEIPQTPKKPTPPKSRILKESQCPKITPPPSQENILATDPNKPIPPKSDRISYG